MHIPNSTYRLQLNPKFTFADLETILPYLSDLNISDLYLSPILQAQPESTHGYDTIDYQQINQALGGEVGFKHLTEKLRGYRFHLLVDIVPNHMAATSHNRYWQDVVEHGLNSPHADMFDINWDRSKDGALSYRRFFDINELVCLRMEDKRVFPIVHNLILNLIHEGRIHGLRIDHIDGLRNPLDYLRRLSHHIHRPFYLIVEKILNDKETIPREWPICGTTGYDFLNRVNQLFVKEEGFKHLLAIYHQLSQRELSLQTIRKNSIQLVIQQSFLQEFNYLRDQLLHLLGGEQTEVEALLMHFSSSLDRYRLYTKEQGVSEQDAQLIRAIASPDVTEPRPSGSGNYCKIPLANARGSDLLTNETQANHAALKAQFVNLLLLHYPEDSSPAQQKAWQQWHNDWEVFTGPIMAKGFEDTACYAYPPLISLNEVGSGPDYFMMKESMASFHHYNQYKQQFCPHSLNTTATHDTKRSEDVRARLNVLSEMSDEWQQHVQHWQAINHHKKNKSGLISPDIIDELFIYQTLLGAWPLDDNVASFRTRLHAYFTKAMRERKEHSSWATPNPAYETATLYFVDALIDDPVFLKDFLPFQHKIAFYGMYNSLSQLMLKITCPGVPDFYQGNETWRFDLVDPDNRQLIDYALLKKMSSDEPLEDLLNQWQNGQIKFNLMKRLLKIRAEYHELFSFGDYLPLTVQGQSANHIIAFARSYQDHWIIVIAARYFVSVLPFNAPWSAASIPEQDCILLPKLFKSLNSVLERKRTVYSGGRLLVRQVLFELPFALLSGGEMIV